MSGSFASVASSGVVQGVIIGATLAFLTTILILDAVAKSETRTVNGWSSIPKAGQPGNGLLVRAALQKALPVVNGAFVTGDPRVMENPELTAATTLFMLNLWLLGSFDIRTSVFPSGHVTLGFSAAFAMFVAMPERRYLGVTLLSLAIAVMVATIYGRYHYTVDGLAGLGVSLAALAVTTLGGVVRAVH